MEVSGELHAAAALPLRNEPPVAIGLEARWVPGRLWDPLCGGEKFSCLAGNRILAFQSRS
jgi:hypothetical protein